MKGEEEILVPAGKFKAASFVMLTKNFNPNIGYKQSLYEGDTTFSVICRTWYAKGVGMVKREFYGFGNAYLKNLKRWKIGEEIFAKSDL